MLNIFLNNVQGVFRLTARDGIEYLLQAANDAERDSWTVAIADVIRKLEAAIRVSKPPTLY